MSTREPPLVSVVSPFYNTDAYLAECIESVLAQTYPRFEYVLLDNASTDRSAEIAERYAARDPRIRLLHNERTLPQLQNYNRALRHISPTSRWVKMVQADDAIFPRCLEEMVAVGEANPTVGVVSSYRMVGQGIGPLGLPRTKTVLSGREAIRLNLIDDLFLFGSQTTVMMRADLVRARPSFYPEESFFADSDVIYELLVQHDFAFVHQLLSFSRLDEESIGAKVKSYRPLLLDRLIRLKSFGPAHLSSEEYVRHLGEHRRVYARFMAEAWLRRREPEFWEFHRKGLARIGEDVDRSRFVLDAVAIILHHLLRPGKLARWLSRRARRWRPAEGL
jgi:glycosyltransferase involved in cell wall biosynthesis